LPFGCSPDNRRLSCHALARTRAHTIGIPPGHVQCARAIFPFAPAQLPVEELDEELAAGLEAVLAAELEAVLDAVPGDPAPAAAGALELEVAPLPESPVELSLLLAAGFAEE
jgi:hypothetical protein